jgi:protein tyrosine phosphatase
VDYHKDEDPSWMDMVKKVETGGVKMLLDEYKELKKEKYPGLTTNVFGTNPKKNRYQDVGCWDHTRVVITGGPVDYIHGNFVDGFIKPKQFIATQGPIEDVPGQFDCTVPEFWRMIWEQKCNVIVMLCQTVELGKAKCTQYWPEKGGEKAIYGTGPSAIHVETMDVGQRNIEDHTIAMTMMKVTEGGKGTARSLVHFLHQNWPDRKCPPSAYPIVEFLIKVHTAQKTICAKNDISPDKSPMVVHCSAGIGRSGTFLAIDIALNLVNRYSALNIKEMVRLIRTQRHFAVQTPVQYVCIYQAILEFLVKHKGATFDVAKFAKDVKDVK